MQLKYPEALIAASSMETVWSQRISAKGFLATSHRTAPIPMEKANCYIGAVSVRQPLFPKNGLKPSEFVVVKSLNTKLDQGAKSTYIQRKR